MLTIEEKIRQLEAIAESGDELYADYKERGLQDTHGARRVKSLIEEKRQEIEWLRELVERRKAPEIITCGECVNFAERDFCKVAGHNVHRKSNCMQVFGAERRTDDSITSIRTP